MGRRLLVPLLAGQPECRRIVHGQFLEQDLDRSDDHFGVIGPLLRQLLRNFGRDQQEDCPEMGSRQRGRRRSRPTRIRAQCSNIT